MSNLPVQNPPFLFTYWNPFSKDASLVKNWFDYVKDVSLAKYTAASVGCYLGLVSGQQIKAIHATGQKICGAFYEGMSGLQSQLSNVEGQLNQVSGQLYQISGQLQGVNQRLSLILDEARTSNVLQQNIAELLRIPDSQKQRQHHVELGLKFLKNALRDADLYQDALQELLAAEKLMTSDYFVLHRIGLIYLYAPELGNLEQALDYFTRAAKYAAIESDPGASRLSNILGKKANTRFDQQPDPSAGDVSALAAESYHHAGTAVYALGRFEDAAKMAEKAVKYQAGDGKYLFYLAKYQARIGKSDSAVAHLEKAIELIPALALATIGDYDLNQLQPILEVLEKANDNITVQLNAGIQRLEKWMAGNAQAAETEVPQVIANANNISKTGDYTQKQGVLTKLDFYDDAMLSILPAYSKTMASLDEAFIGQERIKIHLAKSMELAKLNLKPLGHILLLGQSGSEARCIADILAHFFNRRRFYFDWPPAPTGGLATEALVREGGRSENKAIDDYDEYLNNRTLTDLHGWLDSIVLWNNDPKKRAEELELEESIQLASFNKQRLLKIYDEKRVDESTRVKELKRHDDHLNELETKYRTLKYSRMIQETSSASVEDDAKIESEKYGVVLVAKIDELISRTLRPHNDQNHSIQSIVATICEDLNKLNNLKPSITVVCTASSEASLPNELLSCFFIIEKLENDKHNK